jgi:hypothetical protein
MAAEGRRKAASKSGVFMSALDVEPAERLRIKKIGRQPRNEGVVLINGIYWPTGRR